MLDGPILDDPEVARWAEEPLRPDGVAGLLSQFLLDEQFLNFFLNVCAAQVGRQKYCVGTWTKAYIHLEVWDPKKHHINYSRMTTLSVDEICELRLKYGDQLVIR